MNNIQKNKIKQQQKDKPNENKEIGRRLVKTLRDHIADYYSAYRISNAI